MPLARLCARCNLKSGNPLVLRRRQKRLTVGSLTFAILARVAILEWMAVCGEARMTCATFFSDLLKTSRLFWSRSSVFIRRSSTSVLTISLTGGNLCHFYENILLVIERGQWQQPDNLGFFIKI
ncbi:protein of unknown function [Xenorhabdus doucetiae]|uniref:Uncharacterized protein n=1 Tax=Xenorhabdus doucetiae TaxID=351671 RepID=A0A068QVB7_9GAMM|nr:protein of unknown function [Xenorhabdus doucetiae]